MANTIKKYMSLERLTEYDALIKAEIAEGDEAAKSYADSLAAGKANSSHTHDDRYYTESEVDTKISNINTSITNHTGNSTIHVTSDNKTQWNSAYSHSTSAHAPSNAERNIIVGIQKNGTDLTVDSSTRKVNITVPTTAAEVGAAPSSHNHDSAYDAKGAADTALASAKTYADEKVANLLDNSTEAVDSIMELAEAMKNNADAIDALNDIAAGKADASHTHDGRYYTESEIDSKISTLNASIDSKAASSHTHNYAGSSSAGGAATSANKVNTSLTVKLNSGTTEGTNMFTFNGSAAKTVNITASSVGAAASSHTHDDRYYTETEIDTKVSALNTSINDKASKATTLSGYGITDAYTKTQVDSALSGKANTSHGNHVPTVQTADNAKFLRNDNTWQKVTPANIGAAASSHSHSISEITNLQTTLNNASSAITANTNSISTHTTQISTLQAAIEELQEITSSEIQALFA